MQPTTDAVAQEDFIAEMTQRMADLARHLSAWVTEAPRTREAMEQQTVALIKDLGTAVLSGACQVAAAATPAPRRGWPCGRRLLTPRSRTATMLTVLGALRVTRPYYHCAACHTGCAPFDQQIGLCAGSTSAGLDELLALLGSREDSFETAVAVLDTLTLVRVCPNLARSATERLGQVLLAAEQQGVTTAWAGGAPPATGAPARLYVTMDGVLVHTHAGWQAYTLGAVYTTITQVSRTHPDKLAVRAQEISFVGDLVDAETVGPRLWCEAARRGVLTAREVIILGEGAHWIWNLAAEPFPGAVQIVDWYHAPQYIWNVAHAVYGEGADLATRWAKTRLDELWEGQVAAVLAAFRAQAAAGTIVQEALPYFTTNQSRMNYPAYRARAIQIGSGSIESGGHHVIGARLKQAGMIWNVDGARHVATVRTWLKSGRWAAAMALRPKRARLYQRRAA